jgi:hypothetical protein
LTEPKVTAPSNRIDGQLFDDLFEAASVRASRQFPSFCFEASKGPRRDAPARLLPTSKAEAEEFSDARCGDPALSFVDRQLEALCEEPFSVGAEVSDRLCA